MPAVGTNRLNPLARFNCAKRERNTIAEISAASIPTAEVEYERAATIQNTTPSPDVASVAPTSEYALRTSGTPQ